MSKIIFIFFKYPLIFLQNFLVQIFKIVYYSLKIFINYYHIHISHIETKIKGKLKIYENVSKIFFIDFFANFLFIYFWKLTIF